MTLVLTFVRPGPLLSENTARGAHWARVRADLKPWHDAAWAATRNATVTRRSGWDWSRPVPVTVQVVLPFKATRARDPHNYTGTVVKAIVDGIKDAGLVPDDTADWVTVLDSRLIVSPSPVVTVLIQERTP